MHARKFLTDSDAVHKAGDPLRRGVGVSGSEVGETSQPYDFELDSCQDSNSCESWQTLHALRDGTRWLHPVFLFIFLVILAGGCSPTSDSQKSDRGKEEGSTSESRSEISTKRDPTRSPQKATIVQDQVTVEPTRILVAIQVDNIRSGPGTQFDVLRKTKKSEKLSFEKKVGEWYLLTVPTGEPEAWVHETVVAAVDGDTEHSTTRKQSIRIHATLSSPLYDVPKRDGPRGDEDLRKTLLRVPAATKLDVIEWVDVESGMVVIRYFKVVYKKSEGWIGVNFTDGFVYTLTGDKEVPEPIPGFETQRWVGGKPPAWFKRK